jgi:magnesium transporter
MSAPSAKHHLRKGSQPPAPQVEFLDSRMLQLKERIDDTEDLINIDLDNRRNDIVLINLIATSMSIVFAFVTSIAGVFGMNLRSGLEGSSTAFAVVTVLSFLVGFFILGALIMWYRWRGLTFVPDSRILD